METDCKGCLAIRKILKDLKNKFEPLSDKSNVSSTETFDEKIKNAQKLIQDLLKGKE